MIEKPLSTHKTNDYKMILKKKKIFVGYNHSVN